MSTRHDRKWLIEEAFPEIQARGRVLANKKNQDYSSQGHGCFGNLERGGVAGVVIRIDDKVARLFSLVVHDRPQKVEDESIEDTFLDIMNYATLALAMLQAAREEKEDEGI